MPSYHTLCQKSLFNTFYFDCFPFNEFFLVSILMFSMIVFMIKLYLIANPIGREMVSGGFGKINLKALR